MKINKSFGAVLVISPLLLLSGCAPLDWVKGKLGMGKKTEEIVKKGKDKKKMSVAGGEWIVKVGNETVVSANEFEKEFNALIDEQPQLKSMLPLMPNLEKDFAKGLGNQEVVSRYIEKNKIDQSAEYLARKERMERAVLQILDKEFFAKSVKAASMSEGDVKKFYEENKDVLQGILISRGGIKAEGVSFEKRADAQAFLKKAKEAKDLDLQKLAEKNGLSKNSRDFKLVNQQSFAIDPVLRTKILALKEFPTLDIMAIGDKTFWVVHAPEKEDAKYRPFNEVKEGVKNVAEQTERAKLLQKKLETLAENYGVEINDTYFEQKAAKFANQNPAMIPGIEQRVVADADTAQPQSATKAA